MSPPADPRSRSPDYAPFLAVALFTLTLLVFVPAHVYLVNKSNVVVFFRDVLLATTVLATAVTAVLAGLLVLTPRLLRQRITVLLLGVSLLLWFHAYCLVWPYEVLDGGDIAWDGFAGRNLIDAALTIALLAPLLWFTPRVYARTSAACTGLLVIQLASLGISSLQSYRSPLDFFKNYYVGRESLLDFSRDKNVVVIVLDEFQSDIFAEAVLPQAGYRSHFAGFTYFPDTVSGFNYTEFAIPAILTGKIYDNGTSRDAFLRDAYLENSLPAVLKRAGYSVQLYPWHGFANESIYYHEDVASNFKQRPRPLSEKLLDVARLVDLGIFRSLPQYAKRLVHEHATLQLAELYSLMLAPDPSPPSAQDSTPEADYAELGPNFTLDFFFQGKAMGHAVPDGLVTASGTRPVFKFYHLAGLHVPVRMDRDFTAGHYDYTRANFSQQAEAYAKIMGAFLDELRRLNLYDNSMIIILGDHGSGRAPGLRTNPTSPERTDVLNRTAVRNNFQRDKARGIPLLLVKRFGEKGDLRTSRVPASLIDIPATVLAELDLRRPPVEAVAGRPEFHGNSLFALRENQPRPRYYGAMRWAGEKSDYVNPITIYRVDGFSWLDESWSFVQVLEHKP